MQSLTCVVWNSVILGWRNYMEDAHISVSPLSDKKSSLFAVFDGHGGNNQYQLRRWSCHFCWETFCSITWSKFSFQKRSLWTSFERDIFENGWIIERIKRKKINQRNSNLASIKGKWSKLRWVITCWMYSKCMAHYTWVHICC